MPVAALYTIGAYDVAVLEVPGARKTWDGGIAAGYGSGEAVVLEGFGCEEVVRHGRARNVAGENIWPEGGTDITTCMGDSGGAVFNGHGDLVGVTWGGVEGRSVFTQADFILDQMSDVVASVRGDQ